MRKIFYLFLLIFALLAVNFTMWFVHTRTIHNSVAVLKKQLALYKIDLSYEDLYFSNFKAWNTTGIVSKVKFRLNSTNPRVLVVDRINIISDTLKEHLELQTHGKILYSEIHGDSTKTFDINFHNGSPSVEVQFLTSLNSLSDSLEIEGDETPQILRNIKTIKYYDSGFDLVDISNNQKYLSVESSKVSLTSHFSSMSKKYDTLLDIKNMTYNPEYPAHINEKALFDINSKLGANNVHLDLSMIIQPSEHQKESIKKQRESDPKADVPMVFDSFQIVFNESLFSTGDISSKLVGTIDKQPTSGILPYLDIKLEIADYNRALDYYFISLNTAIDNMKRDNPLIPFKPVSSDQSSKFREYLKQFAVNEKDLILDVKRQKDSPVTISGKPIDVIANEIQAMFFNNPTSIPKSNLQSRLSNVAK